MNRLVRRIVSLDNSTFLVGYWIFVLAVALPLAAAAQPSTSLDNILTRAEATNYEETSTYGQVTGFLEVVAGASPLIQLTSFGTTVEGRAMPLAVVGEVNGTSAAEVLASGKTRVFLQANIHAGEVCGKEAMLMFLRDVARGQHDELFDSGFTARRGFGER